MNKAFKTILLILVIQTFVFSLFAKVDTNLSTSSINLFANFSDKFNGGGIESNTYVLFKLKENSPNNNFAIGLNIRVPLLFTDYSYHFLPGGENAGSVDLKINRKFLYTGLSLGFSFAERINNKINLYQTFGGSLFLEYYDKIREEDYKKTSDNSLSLTPSIYLDFLFTYFVSNQIGLGLGVLGKVHINQKYGFNWIIEPYIGMVISFDPN